MKKLINILIIVNNLGLKNCLFVLIYRAAVKLNYYKITLPVEPCSIPDFGLVVKKTIDFKSELSDDFKFNCINHANNLLLGNYYYYNSTKCKIGSPPQWHIDSFCGKKYPGKRKHWSDIKYFDGIDIKNYWELSRWNWAPLLARAWRYSGDQKYFLCLKQWVENWCYENPVNQGVNWSCGQEVSIRLIHAMQSWQILDSFGSIPNKTKGRREFTLSHLKRISATQIYAKAQSNNHWISEAAALFIGGSWIDENYYAELGRKSLEQSVQCLIMKDGSFSQHSVIYHRLVLETLIQVEIWRRWLDLPQFSKQYNNCLNNLLNWLITFVDPISGDAPNLGNNDGANCYGLHNLPYRDFRASLQLGYKVLTGNTLYQQGLWDEPLGWLGLENKLIKSHCIESNSIQVFNDGGYVVFRPNIDSWALLRLPIYKFRPAQSDPLHFDLWHKGKNILIDSGTYSYNCNSCLFNYFSGIESHNTIQFDNGEPMYRISRFLWGNWLSLSTPLEIRESNSTLLAKASYSCEVGNHERSIRVTNSGLKWKIVDQISGFKDHAILRWRICNSNWILKDSIIKSKLAEIKINYNQSIKSIQLVDGLKSCFYNKKENIKVMKIEIAGDSARIETDILLLN